jgi:hypothetical protein
MAEEQKPMPQWIKNLTVPDSTKQYLYNRWLNGEISEKTPPQDWGVITDVAKFLENTPSGVSGIIDFLSGPSIDNQARDEVAPKNANAQKFETFKTLKEFEDNLKFAKTEKTRLDTNIKTVEAWLKTSNASEQLKDVNAKQGTNWTLTSLRDSLPKFKEKQKLAQKNLEISESAFKKAKENNKNALRFLEQDLDTAKKEFDLAKFQFQQGIIDEAARNSAEIKVRNIEADKKKIKEGGELAFAAAGVPGTRATYAFKFSQPSAATATQPGFTTSQVGTLLSTSGPGIVATGTKPAADATDTETDDTGTGTDGTGTGAGAGVVPTTPVVDVAKRKAFVSAQLTARGLENTPANREMLRKEYKTTVAAGKTPEGAAVSNAWETTFRETFPARAWLLDLDRTKYPQLFQLLNTAISQEWYKSPEGLTRFTASLDATDFYKEISQSKQLKTIQSLVGTLGFEGSDFTKFVSDSINFGYDGDILKQKVYEQVFAKDDVGNYINPTALKRTKKSADYISTQNIAKAFFNTNPADSDIENVLTGKILSTDYERQQREFAKTRYGHLSNLLDQGMTLESIASAYKSTASRLLELNPNAIDMSTGAFEQAVTFGEEGKKRLMTNSEWEKLLRTDPQYGWEKTNNAKDEARSLSANIAQAFGRIL